MQAQRKPPLTNNAWWTGYDHAKAGHYFDPHHAYGEQSKIDYRAGYTLGQEERVANKLRPVRRYL